MALNSDSSRQIKPAGNYHNRPGASEVLVRITHNNRVDMAKVKPTPPTDTGFSRENVVIAEMVNRSNPKKVARSIFKVHTSPLEIRRLR